MRIFTRAGQLPVLAATPVKMTFVRAVRLGFFLLLAQPHPALCNSWQTAMGATAKHFRFDELDRNNDRLVREQGLLPGLAAAGRYSSDKWHLNIEAKYYSGDIDYDGQTQSGQAFESETNESMYELDFLSGYRMYRHQSIPVTVNAVLGAGTRLWDRGIKGSNGIIGLDETFRWHVLYAGMLLDYTMPQGDHLTLGATITRNIDPEVEIDFNGRFDDTTLDLGQRYGFQLRAAWTKALSPELGITIGTFLDYREFGRSDNKPLTRNGAVAGTVFQPESESREIGVKAQLVRRW